MPLKQSDQKYLGRDSETDDLQVTRSDGSFVYDSRGKKYIDFFMGWNVGNIGWGQKEIRDAMRRSRSPEYVNPSYLYRPWVELAELLAGITPGKLQKCFRAVGGTEAVEI